MLSGSDREAIAEFLRTCARLGVTLEPNGSTLLVSAPRGVMTTEVRAAIAERKAAILLYHVTIPCLGCGIDYGFHEPRRCFWCRALEER